MSTAVTVERLRDEVAIASAERPRANAEGQPPREAPTGASGRVLGMTLSELTPDLRRRQGLEAGQKGLLIVSVDPLADAAKKVQPGDVIIEMQFEPVETIGQARALAARGERAGAARPTLLHILRDGALTFRSVSPKR
jgi:serine protease Do